MMQKYSIRWYLVKQRKINRVYTPGLSRQHAIKKAAQMTRPVEGFYIDCRCGRLGRVCATRTAAKKDQQDHVAACE